MCFTMELYCLGYMWLNQRSDLKTKALPMGLTVLSFCTAQAPSMYGMLTATNLTHLQRIKTSLFRMSQQSTWREEQKRWDRKKYWVEVLGQNKQSATSSLKQEVNIKRYWKQLVRKMESAAVSEWLNHQNHNTLDSRTICAKWPWVYNCEHLTDVNHTED